MLMHCKRDTDGLLKSISVWNRKESSTGHYKRPSDHLIQRNEPMKFEEMKESISTILLQLDPSCGTALKENVEHSLAQMTHGKTIKYPDEFFHNHKVLTIPPCAYCRNKWNGSNWIPQGTEWAKSVCAQEFECVKTSLWRPLQSIKDERNIF